MSHFTTVEAQGMRLAALERLAAIEYHDPIVLSKGEVDEIKNDGKLND